MVYKSIYIGNYLQHPLIIKQFPIRQRRNRRCLMGNYSSANGNFAYSMQNCKKQGKLINFPCFIKIRIKTTLPDRVLRHQNLHLHLVFRLRFHLRHQHLHLLLYLRTIQCLHYQALF